MTNVRLTLTRIGVWLALLASPAIGSVIPAPAPPLDPHQQVPLSYMQNISGRNGLRIARIGDSRVGNDSVISSIAGGGYAYPVYLYTTSDYLSYANALSGGRLNTDPVAYGYAGGIYRSLFKVVVGNGGTAYTAPVITTNCPGATFGAITLSASGSILAVPVSNAGTGNCPQPGTLTISDPTGSGAILVPVVQGLGTFGQGGEQACNTQYRIGDVTSTNADVVLLQDGTNDVGFGATGQQAATCVQSMAKAIVLSGKRVVLGNNLPRGATSGLGSITQTQGQYLNDLDRILRFWASGFAGLNDDQRLQGIALLDPARECTNIASSFGYPLQSYSPTLPDCMPDGLHLGYGGAVIFAQKLLATLQSWGISFAPASNIGPYDTYDSVNNPGGYHNSNPIMAGNTGTVGTGCTGSAPTDYTISLTSGTSNATCVASLESPRTDGLSGQRAVVTVNSTTGGGTLANYKVNTSHGLTTFNLNVGDPVYVEGDVEVGSSLKMTALTLDITFLNASSQTIQDCAWGAAYGNQGYYSDTGTLGALSSSTPLHPISPRGLTLCPVPAGTNTVSVSLTLGADFSGAANSAGFVVKLSNLTLRKFTLN